MATFELGDASPPNVREPADLPIMLPLFDMSAASPESTDDAPIAYLERLAYNAGRTLQ
jgi:hypothetical protein